MPTAPLESAFQQSTWTDTPVSGNEVTPSISWSAGDVILVVGCTEDNTRLLGVPTATGLTFSQILATNTGSNAKCYIWAATAGSAGSGAVTSAQGDSGIMAGIAAFVLSGSDGVGASALMASTSTTNATVSLTRTQANSMVIIVMGDWNAVNDVAVATSPAGGSVRIIARDSGGTHATMYVGSWPDEGVVGTSSYGIGSYTATPKWIGAVVEIKGSAGAGTLIVPPILRRPFPFAPGAPSGTY